MMENEGTVQAAEFTDKKTRLLVFGILQIIFGGLCVLIIPLMVFGMVMSATMNQDAANPVHWQSMVPAVGIYAALAAWFIVMGIGSIRTRRWARALILISSWISFVGGMMAFVIMLLVIPAMYDQIGKDGKIPEAMIIGMKIGMIVFAAVVYVLIPGLFVLFYSGRDVKATCEARDPQVRWTDKCPLPVLGLSLMCAVWAASLLMMGVYGWAFPFFGTILSGLPGAAVIFALLLLLAYAARRLYKLDIKAWWCILGVFSVFFLSSIMTFSRVSVLSLYEKMNFSEQQMEQMRQFAPLWEHMTIVPMVFWFVVGGAYLVYIRRYFKCNPAGTLGQSCESKSE